MHGGQQASAPCRSICCPQVGAPNFREFAWEGDSTVLDCVLCVKLAKQHISLTRSVRSQPCQWDVVMQLIPFGVALCAPSENLVVRIVLLGRFLLRAGESVHAKSKTAVIYSRALERIRAAETRALARMARNKLPRMPYIHRSPRVDYRDRSPVLSAFAWTASPPCFSPGASAHASAAPATVSAGAGAAACASPSSASFITCLANMRHNIAGLGDMPTHAQDRAMPQRSRM